MATEYPLLPPRGSDERSTATVVNLAMRGKINATSIVTLTPGAAVTALADDRIGPATFIGLSPITASAAGAIGTTFVAERHKGGATLTHASAPSTDRSFTVLFIG